MQPRERRGEIRGATLRHCMSAGSTPAKDCFFAMCSLQQPDKVVKSHNLACSIHTYGELLATDGPHFLHVRQLSLGGVLESDTSQCRARLRSVDQASLEKRVAMDHFKPLGTEYRRASGFELQCDTNDCWPSFFLRGIGVPSAGSVREYQVDLMRNLTCGRKPWLGVYNTGPGSYSVYYYYPVICMYTLCSALGSPHSTTTNDARGRFCGRNGF